MGNQPEWVLSSSYVKQVGDLLGERGVDVSAWLARQGLCAADLDDAERSLPWNTVHKLFADSLQLAEEPGLGLLVGERLRINNHGVVGYAAMNSGTVRQVVELLERFVALRINLVTIRSVERGDQLQIQVEEAFPLGDVQRFLVSATVMALKNILDFITLGNSVTSLVSFAFADEGEQRLAASLCRCPVRYGQSWNGFSLPANILDKPLVTADPMAFEHAEKLCTHELNQLQADTSVSAKVRRLMLTKQHQFPSLEVTARILHMTPRTLHRRLKEEDSAYQEILDEVRHTLSVEYLRSEKISIEELSFTLGYNDASNFRRAFKRWTGLTPSRYRSAVRSKSQS